MIDIHMHTIYSDGDKTVEEVIDIIQKAGGKAFLAHPFEYKFEDTIGFIDDLRKEIELDGIDCFHSSSADDNKIEEWLYEEK